MDLAVGISSFIKAFLKPTDPRPATATSPGSSVSITTTTDWVILDDTVMREYDYGNAGSGANTTLQIRCKIERGVTIHTFVAFILRPYRLPNECFLVAFLGDEADEGSFVAVRADTRSDDSSIFSVVEREGAEKCVQALMQGKRLIFMILDKKEPLMRLPVPNDLRFKITYNACYEQVRCARS